MEEEEEGAVGSALTQTNGQFIHETFAPVFDPNDRGFVGLQDQLQARNQEIWARLREALATLTRLEVEDPAAGCTCPCGKCSCPIGTFPASAVERAET